MVPLRERRNGAAEGEIVMRFIILAALLAATAGCGSEAPKVAEPETPATLPAGDYEVVSEVTKLVSADKSVPVTRLKLGDKRTFHACVAADGIPDPAMFVEAGDTCTANNSFVRAGRLSVQYTCNRPGKGELYPNADGNFSKDGYKAVVTIGTSFPGTGDYTATRMLTARRVGNCPAQGAKPA
jgi:Protein of unknown function (DUF3617)